MTLAFQIIQMVAVLLPTVTEVMKVVQQIFGKGTGEQKKAVAMEVATQAVANDPAFASIPPEVVSKVLSGVIDTQAAALKASGQIQ